MCIDTLTTPFSLIILRNREHEIPWFYTLTYSGHMVGFYWYYYKFAILKPQYYYCFTTTY